MKTFLLAAAVSLFSLVTFSQSLETIQMQIDDLEESKKHLQSQIEEIDARLTELYKTKHELNLAVADNGFPGYTRDDVDMVDRAMRVGQYKTLATIPENTLLLVEEYESGSYKTTYNGISGYISAYQFKLNDPDKQEYLELKGEESAAIRKKQRDDEMKREAELSIQRGSEAKKKREALIRSKYSASAAQKVIDRKIWIGMTEEMLVDSWGKPSDDNINRSVGSWGVHEQWIFSNTYVYIENGKVTSWQD